MDLYHNIICNLSPHKLEYFELESQKRKYVGYTLFQRHYYHNISEPDPPDDIYDALSQLNINDDDSDNNSEDDEDDIYSTSSRSTNQTDNISIETDTSSNDKHKYPKISDIWNALDARQQQFWSHRAFMLNKTLLIGQFVQIPDVLLHNNILSQEKVMNAITKDWQRFVKMFRLSMRSNPSKKQSVSTYRFLNQPIFVGK